MSPALPFVLFPPPLCPPVVQLGWVGDGVAKEVGVVAFHEAVGRLGGHLHLGGEPYPEVDHAGKGVGGGRGYS